MDHIDVQTKVDWFDVAWVEAFVFEPGVQAASESFGVFLFGGTVCRISHKGVQGGAVGDGPKSLSLGLVGHGGIRRRRRRRRGVEWGAVPGDGGVDQPHVVLVVVGQCEFNAKRLRQEGLGDLTSSKGSGQMKPCGLGEKMFAIHNLVVVVGWWFFCLLQRR